MRVSRETQEKTRRRILDAAESLFVRRGFDETTTRELAARARIATGTLFNYFESKEALAVALLREALERGREDFRERLRGDEELEEKLFLHVVCGLRRLEPYRGFVRAVLETALSPFARHTPGSDAVRVGDELRTTHLDVVRQLLDSPADDAGLAGFVRLHLYWSLYLGVLAFWSADASPHQEDTLAVLDESLRVFALHDGQAVSSGLQASPDERRPNLARNGP